MSKNNDSILISPSIIATDLTTLGTRVTGFDKDSIDLLHIDVMDGNYVPNITIGPAYTKALKEHTDIPLDIHLMIENPENSLDEYIAMRPWGITIHYESTRFPARLASKIKEHGILAGLSINPATPVESVFDMVPYFDLILIMSVDPGFYGQSFMEISLKRIEKLSDFIQSSGCPNVLIQVDGGVNRENISSVVSAGASVIVAGGAAFKGDNVNKNVEDLKKSIKKS